MNDNPIYLDYNATTPVLPEVVDAMLPYLREHFGNPSSSHAYGCRAHAAVEAARAQVAALIGCAPEEIIFTSGGTEANNLAIRGSLKGGRRGIVTSVIEHPAVFETVAALERDGFAITRVPVDETGRVRERDLMESISASTALVTLMHSNNETGALQPVRKAVQLAHAAGALVHTDAAQSVGKVPVNVRELGVDYLSIVGHKLYGPKGVGALYARRDAGLEPIMFGGGHERGIRAGTENVASIVGIGAACAVAARDLDNERARVQVLREDLWNRLAAAAPGIELLSRAADRLPNTLNVSFPGVSGVRLLAHATGVAASTGSACHSGVEKASKVLTAMGVNESQALGAVRLSLGRGTTSHHVEAAAAELASAWRTLTS
jgi:cysteine desulfurase